MIRLTAKVFLFCTLVLFGSQAYAATCVTSYVNVPDPWVPEFEVLDVDNNQILSEQEQGGYNPNYPCLYRSSLHINLRCQSIQKKYDINHDGLYGKEEYLLWRDRYKRYFEIRENLNRLSEGDLTGYRHFPATDEVKYWEQQKENELKRLSLRSAGDMCESTLYDM